VPSVEPTFEWSEANAVGILRGRGREDACGARTAFGGRIGSTESRPTFRFMARLIIFLLLAATLVGARAADSKKGSEKSSGADALFREPTVRTFYIDVPEASLAALKQSNHDYVRATFRDGDAILRDAGIRLKGHGTFQPLDRKPAFALKFNEFVSGQEFRGLSKVVLNNSAQDGSLMREWLAAELYHDAGIPAARVTHARVVFNGRDLGFYVLVEAMNKSFLKREFGNGSGSGNLYEGESKDIDQKLDQENGDDTSQKDLKALVATAKAPVSQRLEKLSSLLDVDEFASFLAMEMLTASTGGYTFMRNNYRVFHHPKTDKLMFLPHGLDAAFGSAGFAPPTNSLVVKALWELPDFQKQYHASLHALAEKVWRVEVLSNRVQSAAAKLAGAAPDRSTAEGIANEASRLCYQIEQQARFIASELKRTAKSSEAVISNQ